MTLRLCASYCLYLVELCSSLSNYLFVSSMLLTASCCQLTFGVHMPSHHDTAGPDRRSGQSLISQDRGWSLE